ncbi:MAG: hypothetical protein ACE37B_22490 [Ilumatobacter sp.]|uniref:hypothetical protein n=1 Tax=Ilumatobacter sp. TaxID=1967498 RepID=UPI00391954ED
MASNAEQVGVDLGITIGVTGLLPRWTVSPWGAMFAWGREPQEMREHAGPGTESERPTLDWFVAADDRWHVPADEPTVRQRRIEGTPVVETRVRVPDGDAVQRVWAVPELGGCMVVEFENDSPMPFAVAVVASGARVLTERAPAAVEIQGIDLPDDAILLPIGHRATVRVLVPAADAGGHRFVAVPPAMSVVRGWTHVTERASRLVLPDESLVEALTAARCDLLLEGPVDAAIDPVGFLLDVAELVRCGDDAASWLLDIVAPTELVGRDHSDSPDRRTALDAARFVARRAGDERAARDIERMIEPRRGRRTARTVAASTESVAAGDDVSFAGLRRSESVGRFVRGIERRLVRHTAGDTGSDTAALLPAGFPVGWLGSNFEVHQVPAASTTAVSFAIRWHGERPAVLWEQHGAPMRLTAPAIDSSWETHEAIGEALLAAPAAPRSATLSVTSIADVDPDGGSFA